MDGIKFDKDKVLWGQVPWPQMEQVAQVLTDGAKKYSPENWKKVDVERYREAILRHLLTYQGGEMNDPDSGSHHLAHVVANALIIMWHEDNKPRHYVITEEGNAVVVKPGDSIKYKEDTPKMFSPEWCDKMIKEARPL